MTFQDLKNYIETAIVNTYGYTKSNGMYRLQIWNTKRQFNINRCKDESDYGLARLAVIFAEDGVKIYQCDNGYANYDRCVSYPYTENIACSQLNRYQSLFQ